LPFNRKNVNSHNHVPQQLAIRLALHQQAADEFGGEYLGGVGEEGWGEMVWDLLGGFSGCMRSHW